MQTVKPSSRQLFCQRDEAQEKIASGLIITVEAQEKPQTAEVINVGSAVTEFAQKDKIIYKPYSTTDIRLDGKDYFLIAEEDVLGTVVES